MEIRNFEQFVKTLLNNRKKFVSYECKSLLSPGENYGSVMLQIRIKVLDKEDKENIVDCVGKTVPPNNILWEVFNTKVTFKREIAVYATIVPILNKFGEEKDVDNLMDFFATFLGARISLDAKSNVVDRDAILLLENVETKGYSVMNRFDGLDLECAKILLKKMAVMHATPIAYKLAKPNRFKTEIFPYLKRQERLFTLSPKFLEAILNPSLQACSNSECAPYLFKIKNALNIKILSPLTAPEPFSTFIHNDLWTNNAMFKIINGQPEKAVIVDFQCIEYGLPAHDLVFFLYSSLSLSVLRDNMDFLIDYYNEAFVRTLKQLGHDAGQWSKKELIEQCKIVTKSREFTHLLMMFSPIFTLKDKAKNLAELDEGDVPFSKDCLHENYYSRVPFVLLDLVKRGWI